MSHYRLSLTLLICLILACAARDSLPEGDITPNETAEDSRNAAALYAEYCASCHGADARAFADRGAWAQGSTFEDIKRVIIEGLSNESMPSFKESFTNQELEDLTNYIIEARDQVATYDFDNDFNDNAAFTYNNYNYKLELVTDQVEIPWGIAQTPDGDLFYTDKKGELIQVDKDGKHHKIKGLPQIKAYGQGGLMDVALDPNFEENKLIYLSYSKPNPDNDDEITTAIFKGKLENNEITNGQDIWIALPYLPTRYHFGSRMIWDNDGHLYVTIGDRGQRDVNPQDLSVYPGKVHRINTDGSIPSDNPFVNDPSAIPSIFSYGHRNPQGLVYDAANELIYNNEHGPRGGDEINLIEAGKNYGWPVISYGINYSGTVFTEKTHAPGMEQPLHYWVPAIGVCGMAFVSSDKYPDWQGHLLSGSLKYDYLSLTPLNNGSIDKEVNLFPNIGRLRSVIQGTDGYLYLGLENPGRIYKILPL